MYNDISLSWLKMLFFPAKLRVALTEYKPGANPWPIYNTFLNGTWFFQRWFFSSLRSFSESPLLLACNKLKGLGLLDGSKAQDNFDSLAAEGDPQDFINDLSSTLSLATLMPKQYQFELTVHSKHARDISHALDDFMNSDLLPDIASYRDVEEVINHPLKRYIVSNLIRLKNVELLTDSNFNTVIKHKNPVALHDALGHSLGNKDNHHSFTQADFEQLLAKVAGNDLALLEPKLETQQGGDLDKQHGEFTQPHRFYRPANTDDSMPEVMKQGQYETNTAAY